jgi:S-formylglutathione hydrolase
MASSSLGAPSKRWAHHGGEVRVYTHASSATATPMTFAIFMPARALASGAAAGSVPVIYWLSGLTCTWENFATKGGAFAAAAAAGVAVVAPDTSPRGAGVAGEAATWSLGAGAGFYVDATTPGWSAHYRMATYVTAELPAVLAAALPVLAAGTKRSIMGHSMGGLGAISLALRSPGAFAAVSAFAPISHPSAAPWGRAAYAAFLGADEAAWKAYDPTDLVGAYAGPPLRIAIEQGTADEWLAAELLPRDFLAAAARAKAAGAPLDVTYAEREGYDHSYWFVSTFVAEHIREHAAALAAAK